MGSSICKVPKTYQHGLSLTYTGLPVIVSYTHVHRPACHCRGQQNTAVVWSITAAHSDTEAQRVACEDDPWYSCQFPNVREEHTLPWLTGKLKFNVWHRQGKKGVALCSWSPHYWLELCHPEMAEERHAASLHKDIWTGDRQDTAYW